MVSFPTTASPVRVIGGPTGPFDGPIGPTGAIADFGFVGATGLVGLVGKLGFTGPTGATGLASSLTGPMGRAGPTGADGYPGPMGPTGAFEFIPANRFQTFEYIAGFNMMTSGGAAGCKFYYTPKRSGCILFSMFTGLAEPTVTGVFQLGIGSGVGPAPNAGDFSGYGNAIQLSGAGLSIPFMTMNVYDYNNQYPIPEPPYPARWFDLTSYGGGGWVRNINAVVLEF